MNAKRKVKVKPNASAERKLEQLRKVIDRADEQLLLALAQRFKAVASVGEVKRVLNLPARQNKRWHELVAQRLARASQLKLSNRLLTKIFAAIHGESLRIQTKRSRSS